MVKRQPLLWVVLYNVKDLKQQCSCTHMWFFFLLMGWCTCLIKGLIEYCKKKLNM